MRITGPNAPRPSSAPRKAGASRAAATSFSPSGQNEPLRHAEGASIASIHALSSVDALVALQGEGYDARLAPRERGEKLLDELDQLKLALLDGRDPRGQTRRLRELNDVERDTHPHPGVEAVLRQIDIRSAVELAKWERRNTA
jgi:hypothetical protein